MAADNIVKDAIRAVIKAPCGDNVRKLLDVGFYEPVSNEALRFIVYTIRVIHKRGGIITMQSIAAHITNHFTRGVAKAAKEELTTIN